MWEVTPRVAHQTRDTRRHRRHEAGRDRGQRRLLEQLRGRRRESRLVQVHVDELQELRLVVRDARAGDNVRLEASMRICIDLHG